MLATSAPDVSLVGLGEIVDVEDVKGVRVYAGENNKPMIEYLVSWKVSTLAQRFLEISYYMLGIWFYTMYNDIILIS